MSRHLFRQTARTTCCRSGCTCCRCFCDARCCFASTTDNPQIRLFLGLHMYTSGTSPFAVHKGIKRLGVLQHSSIPKRKHMDGGPETEVDETYVASPSNNICNGFFAPSKGPQSCQVQFPYALRSKFVPRDAHSELEQMFQQCVAEGSARCATPPHSPRAAAQLTCAPCTPRKARLDTPRKPV